MSMGMTFCDITTFPCLVVSYTVSISILGITQETGLYHYQLRNLLRLPVTMVTQVCIYFSLQAIAIGDGWVAVATNLNMLRLFTIGGIQLNMLCIPGPVVTMAAHVHKLSIAYSSVLSKFVQQSGIAKYCVLYEESCNFDLWCPVHV